MNSFLFKRWRALLISSSFLVLLLPSILPVGQALAMPSKLSAVSCGGGTALAPPLKYGAPSVSSTKVYGNSTLMLTYSWKASGNMPVLVQGWGFLNNTGGWSDIGTVPSGSGTVFWGSHNDFPKFRAESNNVNGKSTSVTWSCHT